MNKHINTLIVEDEILTIKGLTLILEQLSNSEINLDFKIKSATNCDTANNAIEEAVLGLPIDLVLLDINIPASKDGKLISGEDLGLKIRDLFPKAKIIVFTSHNNNYRLNNIFMTVNPDAFLIKTEINMTDLTKAVKKVLSGEIYYSNSILHLARLHISNYFTLDLVNRQILHFLSKGIKTKDLPDFIDLSLGAIERRKRAIKELFNVEDKDDSILIMEASKKGFI